MQRHYLADLICEYGEKYKKNPDLLFVSNDDYLSLEQFSIQNHSPLANDCRYQGNKNFFGAIVMVVDAPLFKAECFMIDDVEHAIKTGFNHIKKYRLSSPLQGNVNEDSPLDKEVDFIQITVPDVVKDAYIKNISLR